MKKLLMMSVAALFATCSFSSLAVQQLSEGNTGQLRPSGTVSVTGASNLDDLQHQLAEKAHEDGAKGYIINSAGGDNKMYGTATIYK